MNKQLLRKLMAGLLACAMLLASVVAFAGDEEPVNPETAATEEVEKDETSDATEGKTETTDSATNNSETGDAGDSASDPADGEDVDTTVDGNDDATADEANENEDNVDGEGDPVTPPIIFGEVPDVEGAEDADEADNANAKNGIAPKYFHKHEHKYELYVDPEGIENPKIQCTLSYDSESGEHTVSKTYEWLYRCQGCSDVMYKEGKTSTFVTKDHIDYNKDDVCDCEGCLAQIKDPSTTTDEPCIHEKVNWGKPVSEKVIDTFVGIYSNYDVNTDKFTNKNGVLDRSVGHAKILEKTYKAHCNECDTDVTQVENECIYEPHSFSNGKCTVCGYKKPVTKKADTRVRMGVKLMQEIRKLAKDGVTVSLRDEQLAYTEAEFAAVSAISDPFERALLLLAALGYGDEVDYAIKNQGLEVSDAALALIAQLGGRDALPGTAEVFLSTAKVNGAERDVVTISLVLSGNGVATKSYTFYKDGSNLYFFD